MNPMKKKTMRIMLLLLLVTVLVSAFSMTAFAAGDVAGAIENTWNAAKGQIQTVVNNVVFPVCDMILAILFLSRSARHISTTESTGSLSSPRPVSSSPALFSPLPRRCISGRSYDESGNTSKRKRR